MIGNPDSRLDRPWQGEEGGREGGSVGYRDIEKLDLSCRLLRLKALFHYQTLSFDRKTLTQIDFVVFVSTSLSRVNTNLYPKTAIW